MRLTEWRRTGWRRTRRGEGHPDARVRLDRRTKRLTQRLRPGEIAVIDHLDLDQVSADALVRGRPAAVVNVARSISGRYPTVGPELVVGAGIPLLDEVGPEVFTLLQEGQRVRLDGDTLYRLDGSGAVPVAKGRPLDLPEIRTAMADAREGLSTELAAFAANTLEYLQRERELLLEGLRVPQIRTPLRGRHALVVVRGHRHREDLAALRPYIRERRPVLIGVDGGADALREAGYRPDLVVGDMDSVSDEALRSGAELVVHAYPDGRAPGLARLQALGLPAVTFRAAATSEDVALLLADELEASLVVAVGSHATLEEFLDKGRDGMASTFLTRMRVGSKLVDAKGVSRLYHNSISLPAVLAFVIATVVTLVAALALSTAGRIYVDLLMARLHDLRFSLSGLL